MRLRRLSPRRSLAATGAIVLAVAAVVFGAAQYRSAEAPRVYACATGALASSGSRPGRAIFAATNFAPGDSTTGTVTIRNPGNAAASLAVAPVSLRDLHARGGGALSAALDLTVEAEGTTVWSGKLGAMRRLSLTALPPGAARTYRFTARLPANGAGGAGGRDNDYQSSSVDVAYEWTLAGRATSSEARQCRP